ncbi:phospholipase carboxylesterase [Colletotrichum truncatum]|uniref:Phospholipase carboxylesterase n=1 Tax=Colletotrichum truncatum TaxID=5467 RepID=A0ACC3Z7R9_COLTU|nr:phospholipase carboxylesterase [Colletotrichum truncatum]KAF6782516.1 phospholipase carboxylesterase [Colletotrichum truncatum]
MGFELHTVSPKEGHTHTHTVIFLHGRDSECQEFADEFFESEATEPAGQPRTLGDIFPTFKWVFPGASLIHSERFGVPMSQWFDIWSVESPSERSGLQHAGLVESVDYVLKIVDQESAFVPCENIYLGGISQGFVTAVAAFFAGDRRFAGLIGLCSWALPALSGSHENDGSSDNALEGIQAAFGWKTTAVSREKLRSTPIFLGHAVDDDVVPIENGKALRSSLSAVLGSDIEWHEYQHGGHWINEPEGVDDIVGFIKNTTKVGFIESM